MDKWAERQFLALSLYFSIKSHICLTSCGTTLSRMIGCIILLLFCSVTIYLFEKKQMQVILANKCATELRYCAQADTPLY